MSVSGALRRALSSFGRLLAAAWLVGFGICLRLLLLIVPGIIALISCSFYTQALMIEDASATASVKRSKQLTGGPTGTIVPSFCAPIWDRFRIDGRHWRGDPHISRPCATPRSHTPATTVRTAVAAVLVCFTLAYFDARIRDEGFDLELQASGLPVDTADGALPSSAS